VSTVDPSPLAPDLAPELVQGRPLRQEAWRRFRHDKVALASLVFLGVLALAALTAPVLAPYGAAERVPLYRSGPSWSHLFGTDVIGRDVFSRILHGARVSLTVGVLATSLSLAIGVLVGAVAGYFGGWVDTLLTRAIDVLLAVPYVVLAIAVASVFGGSQLAVILIIGVTAWTRIARVVRASFLALKQQEYVEAAIALGFSRSRIMFRHILPNALQPIIVYGTLSVAGVILTEAALSFLGVGVQDPTPAWGLMIAQGRGQLVPAPHLLLFPAGALVLTVLAFVFVGDGLRDALDPRQD
jgi:ABC-type dipeptide/oligopeptide/nickel transport system permease subunit